MHKGICKSCGVQAKLVQSHIIPRSLHRPVIESEGVAHIYSTDLPYRRRSLTGIYDYMLCETCERLFQNWDNYGKRFFLDLLPSIPITRADLDLIHAAQSIGMFDDTGPYLGRRSIQEYDYPLLKLFLLSVLWRAELASHDFFHAVKLGSHEGALRAMLFSSNPGVLTEYPIFLFGFDSDEAAKALFNPHRVRIAGLNAYRLMIAGYSIIIKVDRRPFPEPYSKYVIGNNLPLHVPTFEWRKSAERLAILNAVTRMPEFDT